jgi:hypothetical protein
MGRKKEILWLVVVIVCSIIVTVFMLSYMVTDPGHVLIKLGGDASKNYFTYLYHILYEKGAWFNGMNYPFGDNLIYADAQPFLSIPLSYLHLNVSQALAIMHLLIVLSYVLAIVFVYKLLIHFNVDNVLALIFAILIVVMSPQVMRLEDGHYGMAYLCFYPMLFYWTAVYSVSGKKTYSFYLFVLIMICGFLHPYYFAFAFVWLISYCVVYFIFKRLPAKSKFKHTIPLLLSLFMVFVFVQGYLFLTDPVEDRPSYPWGIFVSRMVKNQLFTSIRSPFWSYIKAKQPNYYIAKGTEDGYSYLGIGMMLVCIISIGLGIFNTFKRNRKSNILINDFSPLWIFIGLAFLCLAMCIPFRWNIEWFYSRINIFRQFRAIGRFAWGFYFVVAVYTVVVLQTWHNRLKGKKRFVFAYFILIISCSIWTTEAIGYVRLTRNLAKEGRNNFDLLLSGSSIDAFLRQHNRSVSDFQSILTLPYFHFGSERFWINTGAEYAMTRTYKLSLESKLPIVEIEMTRTSYSQSKQQVRIIAGPFADKSILDKMNKKPLLLVYFNGYSIDDDSKYLLEASELIGHFDSCRLYACYLDRILANDKRIREQLAPVIKNIRVGDTCINCSSGYFIQHFDNIVNHKTVFGTGALAGLKKDDTVIAEFPVKAAGDSQFYECSAWELLNQVDYNSPDFILELLDNNKRVLKTVSLMSRESVDNYDAYWFRISKYFWLPPDIAYVRFVAEKKPNTHYLVLDEIVLRPVNSTIISKFADGTIMVNNHKLKE